MKKTAFLWMAIAILSIVVGFFVAREYKGKIYINSHVTVADCNEEKRLATEGFFNRTVNQFANEDCKLNPIQTIMLDGKELTLSELVGNKPRIIMRYSELHCQLCVEDQLTFLKDISEKIGYENVAILTTYRYKKDLDLFKRLNQLIHLKVYQVDSLNLPAEELNTPYVFVVGKDMKATMFFVPDKEIPSLSKQYYSIVKERFFTTKHD